MDGGSKPRVALALGPMASRRLGFCAGCARIRPASVTGGSRKIQPARAALQSRPWGARSTSVRRPRRQTARFRAPELPRVARWCAAMPASGCDFLFGHFAEGNSHSQTRVGHADASRAFYLEFVGLQLYVYVRPDRVGGGCFDVAAVHAYIGAGGPGAQFETFLADFDAAFAFVARTAALLQNESLRAGKLCSCACP